MWQKSATKEHSANAMKTVVFTHSNNKCESGLVSFFFISVMKGKKRSSLARPQISMRGKKKEEMNIIMKDTHAGCTRKAVK